MHKAPTTQRAITRRATRRSPLPDYRVAAPDRKSTRLNSSHSQISYAVFCLKKKRREIGLGSDRVFRYLVDTVRDYAIVLLDRGGHVATWNPGAHRIKQYTAEVSAGSHSSIF